MSNKILALIITPLLLTGCFGSNTETTDHASTSSLYETEKFSINLPQDWEVLEREDFTSNVPIETVVAFRNNIKNEVFTSNVSISVSSIPENFTSEDMAKSSKANAKSSLLSYQEISNTESTTTIGSESIPSYIIDYQGKKTATEPIVHFKQLHVAYNGLGYTVTSGYLPNEDESVVKTIEAMLDSFALK